MRRAVPDVVLLDLRMPVMDGVETIRAMTKLGARDRGQLVAIAYRSGLTRAGRKRN